MRTIKPEAGVEDAQKKFDEVVRDYEKAINIRKEIGAPAVEVLSKAASGVHREAPVLRRHGGGG